MLKHTSVVIYFSDRLFDRFDRCLRANSRKYCEQIFVQNNVDICVYFGVHVV